MSEPKLLPCPFCGKKPEVVIRDVEPQNDPWYGEKKERFVLCDCGACLFDGYFHEGFWEEDENNPVNAIKAWNTRAALSPNTVMKDTDEALAILEQYGEQK